MSFLHLPNICIYIEEKLLEIFFISLSLFTIPSNLSNLCLCLCYVYVTISMYLIFLKISCLSRCKNFIFFFFNNTLKKQTHESLARLRTSLASQSAG